MLRRRIRAVPSRDDAVYPRKQTFCGVLCREGNWKCFTLTLMIFGCLGSVVWCNVAEVDRDIIDYNKFPIKQTIRKSPCDIGYAFIPIAFVLLLYLVYLVECYHSTARIQLSRRVDLSAISTKLHIMKSAIPRVWWKAICYHYVRRKRQVTRYRNGDAYTTTQVYYERVNTHTSNAAYTYEACGYKDASKKLILDEKVPIIKIRFNKGFAFANLEAANDFEDQRANFFSERERFDDFMEMREGLDLIGITTFKEYMVAYREIDKFSWYSSRLVFWTLSCLLLSWPHRIMIEINTAYINYTVTKIFGINYGSNGNTQNSVTNAVNFRPLDPMNFHISLADEQSAFLCTASHPSRHLPLSHASTIDSLELYAAIRENCAMIPSYSEALRIDADEPDNASSVQTNNNEREALIEVHSLPQPNNIPLKAVSLDEAYKKLRVTISSTQSTSNINTTTKENKQLHRRSWGGRSARQILEELRSARPVSYRAMQESEAGASGENDTIIYASPLSPTCPRDPFAGRAQTTPTDEPPTYEEALMLPALRRMNRSISGTDFGGPRRAFIKDVLTNRSSCLEGVGILSTPNVVRIAVTEPGDETAL